MVLTIIAGILDVFTEHNVIKERPKRSDYILIYFLGIVGAIIIKYGVFINTIVSFIIVSFSIFLVIKQLSRFKQEKKMEAPVSPPSAEVILLSEIRDLLKK